MEGGRPPPCLKDQTQLTLCCASTHSCLALLFRRVLSGKHKNRCLELGSAALILGMIRQTQEKSLGTISDGLEGYIRRRAQGHLSPWPRADMPNTELPYLACVENPVGFRLAQYLPSSHPNRGGHPGFPCGHLSAAVDGRHRLASGSLPPG